MATPKNKVGRPKKVWGKEGVRIAKPLSKRSKRKGLSDRHRKVVNEFFKNGFKKTAALKACGYAETVCAQPWYIFNRLDVREAIEARHKTHERKGDVTIETVKAELAKLAFANPGRILLKLREHNFDLNCLSEDELTVVNEMTEEEYTVGRGDDAQGAIRTKLKVGGDKRASLVDLGKHMGMFEPKTADADSISIADLLHAGRLRLRKKTDE